MDWNWFFGAVSQSSAAIVGIFGAFIVRGVLDCYRSQQSNSIRFDTLQKRSEYLKVRTNALSKRIEAYKKERCRYALIGVSTMYKTYHENKTSEEYLFENNYLFPLFMSDTEKLKYVNGKLEQLRAEESLPNYTKIREQALSALDDEYQSVLDLYEHTREHSSDCDTLYQNAISATVDVRRIKGIITVMFLLLCLGVILPLEFLPVSAILNRNLSTMDIVKHVLLLIISILFYLMTEKFNNIISFSESQNKMIEDLKKMRSVSYYSPHFNDLVFSTK